jgi:hypothetical protein
MGFECNQVKKHKCYSTIKMRLSKRYVSDDVIIPVYEVVGCLQHNHPLMSKFCDVQHEHTIVDLVFDSKKEADDHVTTLREGYSFNRKVLTNGKRLRCNRKVIQDDPNLPNKACPAHMYILEDPTDNAGSKFRIKGCLTHIDESGVRKREIDCKTEHTHDYLEMKFNSIKEFENYFEEKEWNSIYRRRNTRYYVEKKYNVARKMVQIRFVCTRKPDSSYKHKRQSKVKTGNCDARFTLIGPVDDDTEEFVLPDDAPDQDQVKTSTPRDPITIRGCVAHSHALEKTRLSNKFRTQFFDKCDSLNISAKQKMRSFRRFRDMVRTMKKRNGLAFLDTFSIEDLNFDKECVVFRDSFINETPQPKEVRRLLGGKKSEQNLKGDRFCQSSPRKSDQKTREI